MTSESDIFKIIFPYGTPGRIIIYIVAAFMILSPFFYSFSTGSLIEPSGENVAADFGAFYTAGKMAKDGDPAEVYQWRKVTRKFNAFFGLKSGGMTFSYPPPVLLPLMALSELPYRVAAFVWLAGGLLAFALMLRTMALPLSLVVLVLALPGVAKNLSTGQTDLYLVAALGAGLALLDRRPIIAGILFAITAMKPQLAVLVPIALLAGRHWQALFASAICFVALNAVAALWFDVTIWPAVLNGIHASSELVDSGAFQTFRMPSIFIILLNLGLNTSLAFALHMIVAVSMAVLVATVWWKSANLPIRSSVLVAATPLISPYIYGYDLVLLILPIVWLWQIHSRSGWRQDEQWLLLIAIIIAWLPNSLTKILGFQPGIVAVFIVLFLSLRCYRQSSEMRSVAVDE